MLNVIHAQTRHIQAEKSVRVRKYINTELVEHARHTGANILLRLWQWNQFSSNMSTNTPLGLAEGDGSSIGIPRVNVRTLHGELLVNQIFTCYDNNLRKTLCHCA